MWECIWSLRLVWRVTCCSCFRRVVSCGKWPPCKCRLYNPKKLSLGVTTEKLIDQLKMLIDHGLLIGLKHTARKKTKVRLDCKCATRILWHALFTRSALSHPPQSFLQRGRLGFEQGALGQWDTLVLLQRHKDKDVWTMAVDCQSTCWTDRGVVGYFGAEESEDRAGFAKRWLSQDFMNTE